MKEEYFLLLSNFINSNKLFLEKLLTEDGFIEEEFNKVLSFINNIGYIEINRSQLIEFLIEYIALYPILRNSIDNKVLANNKIVMALTNIHRILNDHIDLYKLNDFYNKIYLLKGDYLESQEFITELINIFYRSVYYKKSLQLGIVYTPIEVVNFMIKSLNDILESEFNINLNSGNINILDGFTGVGIFVSKLIELYNLNINNIYANEIDLLAYFIGSLNIENVYYAKTGNIINFDNLHLKDTFDSYNFRDSISDDIRVIIGNPPYSMSQRSENNNIKHKKYSYLEDRLKETYVKQANSVNKMSLYDLYIKSFRWASDVIGNKGVICFITNGGWLKSLSGSGFRKCLEEEFNNVYVFDLRGDGRCRGEYIKKEGGKIFGDGSRTPIAITILVKNNNKDKSNIFYYDIGDYLTQKQKKEELNRLSSINNINFRKLDIKEKGNWFFTKSSNFNNFYLICDTKKKEKCFFDINSNGISSGRDNWVINYSKNQLSYNIKTNIEFYNNEVDRIKQYLISNNIGSFKDVNVDNLVIYDNTKLIWSRNLKSYITRNIKLDFDSNKIKTIMFSPFNKQFVYFDNRLCERLYQNSRLLVPNNKAICLTGRGSKSKLSPFICSDIVSYRFIEHNIVLPMYYYDNDNNIKEGISDYILEEASKKYSKVTKEDIFYYIYGILHSPDYYLEYKNDLYLSLARLPLLNEELFIQFSKAGNELADLHLNYERLECYNGVIVEGLEYNNFYVNRIKFLSRKRLDTIIYNNFITIKNIPLKAYEYIVNGKSPIKWVIDSYMIIKDKESLIENNPNEYCKEVNNERYILDLLLSVITLSMKSLDIIEKLPRVNFRDL
jgi:predicted helicase